jgi:glycosyltransferase involved in cell wall biosynthesis
MNHKKILFIGSFKLPKDRYYGGVYFASTTFRDGLMKEGFQIVEMDTTLKDISETRVHKRLPNIILRQLRFLFTILFNLNSKYLFVFLSGGGSYVDKVLPIFLAKILYKKVVIFARSGHLIRDYKKNKFKFFIKSTLEMSDKIICQSTFWKSYFSSLGVKESKLEIIENWVDDEKISESKNLYYPSYNKDSGESFKIIFVSRIEKAKGVDDIILLANNLKNKLNFSIHIYGAGSYENEFENNIKDNHLYDVVQFHGWLEKKDMLKTINTFHLAVFSSQIEGYPNALLDYIFAKIPIIASDISMVKAVGSEIMSYYKQGNVDDITNKVLFISNNYQQSVQNIKELYDKKSIYNSLSFSLNKLTNILK